MTTIIKDLKIIGLSIRTSNQNNKAAKDLEELWGSFFAERLLEKIPNKLSNNIYSIYTDYESDFTGEYTVILGIAVSTLDNVPEDMVGREFPNENFEVHVAKGEMPQAVVQAWNEIWANDEKLNRKYTYDFELYDEKSHQEKESEVKIYLALESK